MSANTPNLTRRERAIWLHVCAGRVNREIASRLEVTPKQIVKARTSLRRKLGIRGGDVPALVRAAAAAGLLAELPPLVYATTAAPTDAKYP